MARGNKDAAKPHVETVADDMGRAARPVQEMKAEDSTPFSDAWHIADIFELPICPLANEPLSQPASVYPNSHLNSFSTTPGCFGGG